MKLPKISKWWMLLVLIPLMGQGCWGCNFFGGPTTLYEGDPTSGLFSINPLTIKLQHPAGFASCPDLFPQINLNGPEGGSWSIQNLNDRPNWLNFDKESGSFPDTVQPSFPCTGYQAEQSWTAQFTDGTNVLDVPIDLLVDF